MFLDPPRGLGPQQKLCRNDAGKYFAGCLGSFLMPVAIVALQSIRDLGTLGKISIFWVL